MESRPVMRECWKGWSGKSDEGKCEEKKEEKIECSLKKKETKKIARVTQASAHHPSHTLLPR